MLTSSQAYKRNPMRAERLCSLGRYLRNKPKEALDTYSAQWLEMSLDDSAIRRITIPESFLCADACLILLLNITAGLVVYEEVVKRRIEAELPFVSNLDPDRLSLAKCQQMATENLIMACVQKGLSRQDAHEEIRQCTHRATCVLLELIFLGVLSLEAAAQVKERGRGNDLIDRIRQCDFFEPIHGSLDILLDPNTFTGRAAQQVEKFTQPGGEVETALKSYHDHLLDTIKTPDLHV